MDKRMVTIRLFSEWKGDAQVEISFKPTVRCDKWRTYDYTPKRLKRLLQVHPEYQSGNLVMGFDVHLPLDTIFTFEFPEKNARSKYFMFLDNLRDMGVVNMFGAAPYLVAEFGISKDEARTLLTSWMNSFS